MNDKTEANDLQAHISSQTTVLNEVFSFLESVLEEEIGEEKDRKNGLVVAGILENYYTAAETILFRIAQEFGNNLSTDHWHADLLDRLSRTVVDVRPNVLSSYTHDRLDELRRFRHFKRYYYRLDYDWDKLDFLLKKMKELHPALLQELQAFTAFLQKLTDLE